MTQIISFANVNSVNENKEVKTLSNMLFDVEMVDVCELLPNFTTNNEYSRAIVGTIEGQKKLLNVCSPRYELIPCADIFLPIKGILETQGISYTEKYSSENDVLFLAEYTLNDLKTNVGGGDEIQYKINVTHSYNGLRKYAINSGFFRLICSNGLVIPVEGKEAENFCISGKHTVKINDSFEQLNKLIASLSCGNSIENFSNRFAKLAKHELEGSELERVFDIAFKSSDTVKSSHKDYAKSVLQVEANKLNVKPNLWLVYNAVNQVINSDALNAKTYEKRSMLDNATLSELFKLAV